MSKVNFDKSIHKDGIYDIDESCKVQTASSSFDDNIIFTLLALFVFVR